MLGVYLAYLSLYLPRYPGDPPDQLPPAACLGDLPDRLPAVACSGDPPVQLFAAAYSEDHPDWVEDLVYPANSADSPDHATVFLSLDCLLVIPMETMTT